MTPSNHIFWKLLREVGLIGMPARHAWHIHHESWPESVEIHFCTVAHENIKGRLELSTTNDPFDPQIVQLANVYGMFSPISFRPATPGFDILAALRAMRDQITAYYTADPTAMQN